RSDDLCRDQYRGGDRTGEQCVPRLWARSSRIRKEVGRALRQWTHQRHPKQGGISFALPSGSALLLPRFRFYMVSGEARDRLRVRGAQRQRKTHAELFVLPRRFVFWRDIESLLSILKPRSR